MGEKDVKITQDLRIMQAVIKEAIQQNPDAGINIVNIGQIQITSNVEKAPLPHAEEKRPDLLPQPKCPIVIAPMDENNVNKTVGMTGPPEFFEELKRIAAVEGRSMSAIVVRFVREGIDRYNGKRLRKNTDVI